MAELVGLNELQRNSDLTFVAFIAFVLVAALGVRFALYAYWNGRQSDTDAQTMLWGYLLLIGTFATLYGLVGVLRTVLLVGGEILLNITAGLALALSLCLALALRSVHVSMSDQATVGSTGRLLAVGFAGTVAVSTLGMMLLPDTREVFASIHGIAGVVFLAYGYNFGQEQLSQIQVQGTLLDTLLRHLLPVLLFASMVPILELAWVLSIPRTVVLYVQVVFVIMTATALMTATIKLRQNLTGLRG